jgi:hypothetical protein
MKILNIKKVLKEELGLNKGVYNISTRIADSYLNTLVSNAKKIHSVLITRGEYKEFINHRLTKGYFQSQMQVNWIDAELKITTGKDTMIDASYDPESKDPTIHINLTIKADTLGKLGAEYLVKLSSHTPLRENIVTYILHELTHTKEFTSRYKNGVKLHSSGSLHKNTAQLEANPNNISGFKGYIGQLAYFTNESEINARVAECALFVKNLPINLSNEELVASLKESPVWEEMQSLIDVDLNNLRSDFAKLAQDNSTESINKVVAVYLKEALQGISGKDNGFMRLLKTIAAGQFKGDALGAIEAEVKQRGLYFKNKLLKTVGLAVKQHKLHTAINSRA